MLKQLLLSGLAGVVLTAIVMASPNASAACQGYCADKHLKNGCELGYAGCTIYYDFAFVESANTFECVAVSGGGVDVFVPDCVPAIYCDVCGSRRQDESGC